MKIGASHTLSLTPLPLTSPSPNTPHRWVPSHSARPYLAPTVRKVGPSRSPHVRSRCSQARVSQTQPSAEQERSMCAIWLPRVLVRKHMLLQAAALAPVVETGESEDVETRVRPHCDGTGLCRAQIWRSGTHARKQCEIWAQFRPHPSPVLSGLAPRSVLTAPSF